MNNAPRKLTGSLLFGLLMALPVGAQTQLAKLLDPYARPYDRMGAAVAIDGQLVLVGAPDAIYLRNGPYNNPFTYYTTNFKRHAGAAYLFDRTTGAQLHVFRPTDPVNYGRMGRSVALLGNHAVVGEALGGLAGKALVYDTATGAKVYELESPSHAGWGFGLGVAIDDQRIAVGGPWINGDGIVAVYDRATGALLYSIDSPLQVSGNMLFGWSLAMDQGRLLVGSPGTTNPPYIGGRAYLFDAATGSPLAEYDANSPLHGMSFGATVGLEGERVLVSAPAADIGAWETGTAYLFDATTGAQLAQFVSSHPNPGPYDRFGLGAAIENGRVLIGCRGEDGASTSSGIVYVYAALDGAPLGSFWPSDIHLAGFFGMSVAAQGDVLVAGAAAGPNEPVGSGTAYVFDISGY